MEQMPHLKKGKINWIRRFVGWIRNFWHAITPGPHAWQGANWGLSIVVITLVLYTTYNAFAPFGWLAFVLGFLALLGVAALLKGL